MIGGPIDGEGAVYESDHNKGRVGKNSGEGGKSDVSAVPSDGVEDSDKGNTTIRSDRFRIQDLAKAIQERSENKVIVQAKAKELGLWITILPNKNNKQ